MSMRPLIKYGQNELTIIEKKINLCVTRWALDWLDSSEIKAKVTENAPIPTVEEMTYIKTKNFASNHISVELTEKEIEKLVYLIFKSSPEKLRLQPVACKRLIETSIYELLSSITPKKNKNDYSSFFENDPVNIGKKDSGWLYLDLSIHSISIKAWLSPWHIQRIHTRNKPKLKRLSEVTLSTPSVLNRILVPNLEHRVSHKINATKKKSNLNVF